MNDRDVLALVMSAERRWMDNWIAGPTIEGEPVRRGQTAPDLELVAEDGTPTKLSTHWKDRPLLAMLWRHLGCGCGIERVGRLRDEYDSYTEAGLEVVVVAPGEIERVRAYKKQFDLPASVLADPGYETHKAFGLSHWSKEQVLYGTPEEYCSLTREAGEAFQADRRSQGRNLVDDPWMQSGEFVIDTEGVVRVSYLYNYCADYPDPAIFTMAGRLAASA